MTTTPLPPPVPLTGLDCYIDPKDGKVKRYDQARADLEAENKRLREALISAKWLLERDHIDAQKMAVIDKCRAALKEQP